MFCSTNLNNDSDRLCGIGKYIKMVFNIKKIDVYIAWSNFLVCNMVYLFKSIRPVLSMCSPFRGDIINSGYNLFYNEFFKES